ncbi:DUF362 domain-containing protein [Candidatus Sumerlaeota bacterium]|nr:DUF362 domain-containing protein [Candidatus Sumerlaeota bacterium]
MKDAANSVSFASELTHDRLAVGRREFLRQSVLTAAGTVVAGELRAQSESAEMKSKVVMVTSDAAIRDDSPDRANLAVVEKMLEKGICELAAKNDVKKAWETFFNASDSVASSDGGFHLQNLPEVTIATLKGLALAGVASMKLGSQYVTLSRKKEASLASKAAPWISVVKEGMKAAGISESVIDEALYDLPARYAVEPFDALLVVCTLKPHYISGVAGAVKHFATLSKKGPKEYHPDAMVTAGSVLQTDFKSHRKLVVIDALRFARRFAPGHLQPQDYCYPKALIISTDPVAADAVAFDLFLKVGCKPAGAIPARLHIEAADKKYHAGVSDLAKIELRTIKL